ncbi:fungal-specific transcription factor domain-containing protein [Mycena albidolilacea]|uniref:Fungal-specific transcription factor domain-containing protein n=1 Tax=Mycena albidolilacea TaxID=1033008 RepID=A0AAD7ASI9_9AGAR|nr:fungal-specific transcription factor domain-containing protein [Mycena albidolilacea]
MPKGSANSRSRAPYATQACTVCRTKKTKCDGVKPVCGACAATGRDNECSWSRDVAPKKPRTEAHFEALRKRADSLQAYVDLLEGILAKCICQDASHLQFRPQRPEEQSGEERGDSDVDVLDSDEEITQELTVPTRHLKLDDPTDGPLLHGGYFKVGNSPHKKVSRLPAVVDPNASYVLQVEGVDVSQSHPDIDWSRHLPPEVAIERREHDQILDLSFKFHTMFPIIPSLFLRDMYRALSVPWSEEPPTTPHYSPMLHNAILAISAVFSDNRYLREPRTRLSFVQTAQACFDFKKPNPSMVHALALIASFYTDSGERVPAEVRMGTRLCIALDLGADATQSVKEGRITHDEMTGRNRAYWSVFILDVTWSLYWGRDFTGPPRRNTPMPFVDSDIDQILWYHAPAKIPPQANYLTLIFSETAALCVIACQIAEVINNLAPSARPNVIQLAENVTRIDLELNNWKSHLPPQLNITLVNRASSTPHRIMLHLAYWWCFITLHRPFFNRRTQPIQHSDPEVDHVKLCTRAAENVLELLDTWSNLYGMRLASLKMAGVIFGAGTVFLLRAQQATASSRIAHGVLNTAFAQVEKCIRYLHETGSTWASAMRSGDMLQVILNDKLKPAIARRMAERGEPFPTAAAPPRETPGVSGAGAPHEVNFMPTEPPPSYAPSYAPGWDPLSLDFDFLAQMQNTPVASNAESSQSRSQTCFSELDMNGFFPTFDTFWGPEHDYSDGSRRT